MKRDMVKFDLLTWLFSAGAEPQKKAEIRASEIRAQLRWWFRALGGFKSEVRSLGDQEAYYFGGVGKSPIRSRIGVRVRPSDKLRQEVKDADELGAGLNTPLGYLLFPMRSNKNKGVYAGRAHFLPNESGTYAFEVAISLNGDDREWENVLALLSVFGNLGSIGFRARRCMGAIAFHDEGPMPLKQALACFGAPEQMLIKEFPQNNGTIDGCVSALANWFKDWRSYGSSRFGLNESGRGFRFAKKDHDAGVGDGDVVYRAAIGLPIIQQYSSGEKIKNEWEAGDAERFASPVILRPYRNIEGRIIPLVIFVESYKWRDGRKVELFRIRKEEYPPKRYIWRTVSGASELYEAIKADERLKTPSFLTA